MLCGASILVWGGGHRPHAVSEGHECWAGAGARVRVEVGRGPKSQVGMGSDPKLAIRVAVGRAAVS